jgi:battenin
MRLVGISLASFSSGLGELTFLQLSTTYSPLPIAGHCVSYFASGTGAAGLVGALIWWELRNLGVRLGVGLSSVLPLIIPLSYFFLLPKSSVFLDSTPYDDVSVAPGPTSDLPYTSIPTIEASEEASEEASLLPNPKQGATLSARDKWELVKPQFLKYMLPLFCVYLVRIPYLDNSWVTQPR